MALCEKSGQRLASARHGLTLHMVCYLLQFLRCASALPAIFFVVVLVRPSLRALLAMVPMRLDVVRQDFEQGIAIHLLPLRRYRVGMKCYLSHPGSGHPREEPGSLAGWYLFSGCLYA